MSAAMNELQRLHHEFDLADSAPAKFNVPFQAVRSGDVALDSSFDLCDFVEQVRCWAARINERLMLAQKFVSQLAIAGDSPRFDQGNPFTGFAETGVIIFHAFEGAGEWTSRAFRAQAKVHPEKRAFRG